MSSANQPGSFATTHWSLVAAAGRVSSPECRAALETLCESYWYPLYAYVRRKGHQPAEAQDLTQAFFATLLEKERLQVADQHRGRFRSFLLASLNHFIANQYRDAQAQKRGGGHKQWSLDFAAGESWYGQLGADEANPEKLFERRWAMKLLENAVSDVRSSYEKSGKLELFEALKGHLGVGSERVPYREVAEQLGVSEGAIKVAAHRLRSHCRDALRAAIAQTVSSEAEIDEELSYLFQAITL